MKHALKQELLRSRSSEAAALQRVVDVGLLALTQRVACALHGQSWTLENTLSLAVAIPLFLVFAELSGLYRFVQGSQLRQELTRLLTTWAMVIGVLLLVAFATKTSAQYSRVVLLGWFFTAPNVLIAWRAGQRLVLQELRVRGYSTRTVAIAGATPAASRVITEIHDDPCLGMKLRGLYDDRAPDRRHQIAGQLAPDAGTLDDLVNDARHGLLDIVYIALPLRAEPRIASIIQKLADTTATVYVVPDFFTYDLLHAHWTRLGDVQVVSIFDSPFHGLGGWMKRLEDLLIGGAMLMALALPMAAIALGVKLSSPGPVFFRQRRYGLNGREIGVFKFRTMRVTEDGAKVEQAKKLDPRVTRFGAFLRRTSLDELPQLFNVVLGEMSLVGPRPHAVAHNELYRSQIYGYMLRHKVKPGITGWAQVNGWRGETDTVEKMEKRIEHDLYYIHHWRLVWDLKILWLTVFGKNTGRNAY